MTSETSKLKANLGTLSSSFAELEDYLEPLLSQTLPETIIGLEPLQQAKLQTVIPYLVYDLIFIYLKAKGIDPKTHPVVPELDRVRQYFQKISTTENPPPKPAGIDKAAANRFIKHALTQATWTKTAAEETDPEISTPTVRVPVKITSKMVRRAQYEQEMRERDEQESEEERLEVFEDNPVMTVDSKSESVEILDTATNKRRRPAVDPFAGYDNNTDDLPLSSVLVKSSKAEEDISLASHNKPPDSAEEPNAVGQNDGPTLKQGQSSTPKEKAKKKAKKKARKSLVG